MTAVSAPLLVICFLRRILRVPGSRVARSDPGAAATPRLEARVRLVCCSRPAMGLGPGGGPAPLPANPPLRAAIGIDYEADGRAAGKRGRARCGPDEVADANHTNPQSGRGAGRRAGWRRERSGGAG